MIIFDGSFTYTPDPNFSGRDWFTWQVNGGGKHGDYATAFIHVEPATIGMKLTVGNASDPPPPDTTQDTPFIPIGDGYDSDSQSVPNDQLNLPDPADPALVPASLTMSSTVGLWGTWSLSFPSAVRVFQVQDDGSLTAVTSGQQSAAVQVQGIGPLSFLVQGVGPAGQAAISATVTPVSDPDGNPPPVTRPTTQSVTANVGPSPLQALPVKNNVSDGNTPLTAAQQQKAGTIYLPISDALDGIEYKLPLVIHNLTVPAELMGIPLGMTVLGANGNKLSVANGGKGPTGTYSPLIQPGIFLSPSANDIDLFVEMSSGNAPVTLTLGQVNSRHQRATNLPDGTQHVFPTLGKAVITPFLLSAAKGDPGSASGPTDVAQFGTYE